MEITHKNPTVAQLFRTIEPEIAVTHVKTLRDPYRTRYQCVLAFRRTDARMPTITLFLGLAVGEGEGISLSADSVDLWLSEGESVQITDEQEAFNIALNILLYLGAHHLVEVCKRQEAIKQGQDPTGVERVLEILEKGERREPDSRGT